MHDAFVFICSAFFYPYSRNMLQVCNPKMHFLRNMTLKRAHLSHRPVSFVCKKKDALVLFLLSPGGYTPLSSLPCFIRRTLIFSLMSVSCRSGQKQSSAGAITTSKGITPQHKLCLHRCRNVPVLLSSGAKRPLHQTKISEQTNRNVLPKRGNKVKHPQAESKN